MAPARHCDTLPVSDMPQSLLAAQKRERDRILAELVKIKGFMPLLMKPRNGMRWTSQERAELAMQFRALAHLSPYLAVAMLPASFLFLPLLAWWLDRRRHRRDARSPGPGRPDEVRAALPGNDRATAEAPAPGPGMRRADSVDCLRGNLRSKSLWKAGYSCLPPVFPGADNGIIRTTFTRGTA